MQLVIRPLRVPRTGESRAGFTLIEMLVALAVISVASTVFMTMYFSSMNLGKLSRNREVALSIAKGQLDLLMMNPASYQWDRENANADGLFRIRRTPDDPKAGLPAELPTVLPFDKAARQHQTVVYGEFRWRAFGKLSASGLFYEVFVDVYWEQEGRDRHITLTGAVGRGQAEPGWKQEGTQ